MAELNLPHNSLMITARQFILFLSVPENVLSLLQANLSCRSTRAELGTVFTHSNYLTLKYVTDRHSKRGDGFRLVITAFKDTREYQINLK